MNSSMTNEEKKKLSFQRQNAVRNAWKEERNRVANGIGTRLWSAEEQNELLESGKVMGYEGHHMKSVSLYPEHAGDSKNIQFLNEYEHLYGAHCGNYHNLTNGYYNIETQTMNAFGDEFQAIPQINLNINENDKLSIEQLRDEYKKDSENDESIYIEDLENVRKAYYIQSCEQNNDQISEIDNNNSNNEYNSHGMGRR